jgi:hypothetical protein
MTLSQLPVKGFLQVMLPVRRRPCNGHAPEVEGSECPMENQRIGSFEFHRHDVCLMSFDSHQTIVYACLPTDKHQTYETAPLPRRSTPRVLRLPLPVRLVMLPCQIATLTGCRKLAAILSEKRDCFFGNDLTVFLNEMTGFIDDQWITASANHGLQRLHDGQAQNRVLRADG